MANGLAGDQVESLFQDHRGRLWVYAGHELAYFQGNRFIAPHYAIPREDVQSITGDNQRNLWLAGNGGLYHLQAGRLVERLSWPALGHSERAKDLVADGGGVWLSFWNEGAVSYFKDGRIRKSYTATDGLGKGRIADLRLARDGALWAATDEGGLSRISEGRIASLTSSNGLPCNMIHWSIEDNEGSLWLYGACGLVRITRTELEAWIADPGHVVLTTVLDAGDGVRLRAVSASSYSPTVAKSTDGKLWFVAGDGVQIVNPRHLPYNEFPPPVHIEQILADHRPYWQNLPGWTAAAVRLPARTRDVQIYYTALSLTAPEKVHFKYKLEGQDRDWREVISDRDVQYSNLPPRHYRFRVIASNNNGVWTNGGDTLDFSVAPAYYQTNWFLALSAAFLLALLWAAYWFRVRQLRHQFAITLDARVSERTRIARELHDTFLQSFHAVLLRLQTLSYLLPENSEAKVKLDTAIGQIAEAIAEGRDAVRSIRESTVETNDLARAISTLGVALGRDAGSHGPNFHVAVEGKSRKLHPILRDETYKIAAESLRNAFRHAQAEQIEVEIRYDADQFRLRVWDDGKGIDPKVLAADGREGHYGMHGMRERAVLIGGNLQVWTQPDTGTEVKLTVPAKRAYAKPSRRSWLTFRSSAKDDSSKAASIEP